MGRAELERFLLFTHHSPDRWDIYQETIYQEACDSGLIDQPNFTRINTALLAKLFHSYDRLVFEGLLRVTLADIPIKFFFSGRLRSAGARTAMKMSADRRSVREMEISLSSRLIFDAFSFGRTTETVGGIPCTDRLSVLLRLFEHELIHVCEFLVWRTSRCAAPRFQDIILRLFRHTDAHHYLVPATVRYAQDRGLRVGDCVSFDYGNNRLTGFINRIGKRATVLVRDPSGALYTDGHRYRKYYVPLPLLQKVNDGCRSADHSRAAETSFPSR